MPNWRLPWRHHHAPLTRIAQALLADEVLPVPRWLQPAQALPELGLVLWVEPVHGRLESRAMFKVPVHGWLRITTRGAFLDTGDGGDIPILMPWTGNVALDAGGDALVCIGGSATGRMTAVLSANRGPEATALLHAVLVVMRKKQDHLLRLAVDATAATRAPFRTFVTPRDLDDWASRTPEARQDTASRVSRQWLYGNVLPTLTTHQDVLWYADMRCDATLAAAGAATFDTTCYVTSHGLQLVPHGSDVRCNLPWNAVMGATVDEVDDRCDVAVEVQLATEAGYFTLAPLSTAWTDDGRLIAALCWRLQPRLWPKGLFVALFRPRGPILLRPLTDRRQWIG